MYSLDEQILDACLFEVWEAYTPISKRNVLSFEMVKENLKRIIQPQKQEEEVEYENNQKNYTIYLLYKKSSGNIDFTIVGIMSYYFIKKSTKNDLATNEYSIETAMENVPELFYQMEPK